MIILIIPFTSFNLDGLGVLISHTVGVESLGVCGWVGEFFFFWVGVFVGKYMYIFKGYRPCRRPLIAGDGERFFMCA